MNSEVISGYFDYNATTPMSESVANRMTAVMSLFCNASSSSTAAQEGKSLLNEARDNVARLLKCAPRQVAFTSGGAEANNWAIKASLLKVISNPGHVITSAIEHPSVLDVLKYFSREFDFEVSYVNPDEHGKISAADIEKEIRSNTQLISVMYANNETGVIQPIEDIAALAKANGIRMHSDCVQIVGKKDIDISKTGVDFASFSGHKFYGPKGIGGLYIRDPDNFEPLIHGGGQEMGLRAGTENILAITGLSQAAQDCVSYIGAWDTHYRECREYMVRRLDESPVDITYNGVKGSIDTVPNTLNFSVDGVRGEALAALLDKKFGIMISIGSACSNNSSEKKLSHVLTAMGYSEERIQGSIRVSLGRYTSIKTIDRFVDCLIDVVAKLKEIGSMV